MVAPPDSGPSVECPNCKTALPSDATYCLQCGARIPVRPVVPAKPVPVRPNAATIMGVSSSALFNRTIPAPAPPVNVPAAPTIMDLPNASTLAEPMRVPNAQRTMMGVATDQLRADAQRRKTAGGIPPQGGTMHGAALAPSAHPSAVASSQGIRAVEGNAPSVDGTSQRPRRERAPMMGGPIPGVPADTFPPVGATGPLPPVGRRSAPAYDSAEFDIPGMPRRRKRSGRLPVFVMLGCAAALGVAAVAFYVHPRMTAAPGIPGRLQDGPSGTELALDLADAPPGTRIRYRGTEYPVGTGGSVSFPAGPLPPEVGIVALPIEILRPSSQPVLRTAEVLIAWRVEPDLQHLGEDPAVIHLVFHVQTGSTLSVAGHAITIAGDMGIAEIHAPDPLPIPGSEPQWASRFPIRVESPGGSIAQGEYELRIPRAALRIDSPGPAAAVTGDTVTIRGRAAGASRITVGDLRVTPSNGSFTADVHPSPGQNDVLVTAWAPGAVPARTTIHLYRDVTVQAYLGTSAQGPSAIASPSPADGIKVRLDGRVLGAPVAGPDGPTFQLLVEDRACRGGRCLVWINPSEGIVVHDGDHVEVVGETHGTRAYTTQGGERRSDPVVLGLFVLPPHR